MNFVAMDFETANGQRDSACSIALVVVRNDQIVDQFYTLIKPETYFSSRNSQIHGIYEEDVAQALSLIKFGHTSHLFSHRKN